jgi:hypothetical protein
MVGKIKLADETLDLINTKCENNELLNKHMLDKINDTIDMCQTLEYRFKKMGVADLHRCLASKVERQDFDQLRVNSE